MGGHAQATSRSSHCRALCWPLVLAMTLAPLLPMSVRGQAPAPDKVLIAVLDVEAVDATAAQASAMTDRLREEMLRTGRFTLVDRSMMNKILDEQAFQQAGCTSQECAVQVGRLLGVRKIVAGRVTRLSDELWLLSGMMVDVETAETVRAESVQYEGPFTTLLSRGIAVLAAKLSSEKPSLEEMVKGMPGVEQAGPSAQLEEEKGGWPWWVWTLIGVGVVGLALAAGGKDEPSDPCPSGAGSCGTIVGTW